MKKLNQLTLIEKLQQKLDERFGKGIYKAAVILFLFGSLSFVSCKPDTKEQRLPTFPTTETPAPSTPAPPNKITITNTKQTVTSNPLSEVYEDFPVVIDAFFAKKNKKENETEEDSFEQIKSASLNSEVYVVVDTFNLTGKNVELKILDKDGIITESKYGQLNFLQDEKDVNGTFKSKIDKFNAEKENEYAIFKINLKGKDEATTADWTGKINASKDKKLNLCLEVKVTDEEDVVYCGVNKGSESEDNRWLDQEGKWFEVNAITTIIVLDPGHGVKPGNLGTQARKYKLNDDVLVYDVLSLPQSALDDPNNHIVGDNDRPSGGYDNENTESNIVYDVSILMKSKLNDLGFSQIFITRSQRETIKLEEESNFITYQGGTATKSAAINFRSSMTSKLNADYFISIHCDGAINFSKGAHTIYSDDNSKQLAIDLLDGYDITNILEKSPHKRSDLGVLGLKNAAKKKVLIELGYLTSPSDAKSIIENKEKIADLLVKGLIKNIEG